MANRIKWSLIGVPDHQGVFNVGGRIGAAQGPSAFNDAFNKFKGIPEVLQTLQRKVIAGPFTHEVEKNHQIAADSVEIEAKTSDLTVVVGGGHDHGYSHLLGIRQAYGPDAKIGCINIDAHYDVRKPSPLIGSGSPFYLALENGIIKPEQLIEFGIQTHCNSKELVNYIHSKNIEVVFFESLRRGQTVELFETSLKKLSVQVQHIVVSLDLDAVAECFAPGVSAPQAEGFSSSEVIEMMEIAGLEKKVCSLGIFELNPLHDTDGRTARLGATCAHHFVSKALLR